MPSSIFSCSSQERLLVLHTSMAQISGPQSSLDTGAEGLVLVVAV